MYADGILLSAMNKNEIKRNGVVFTPDSLGLYMAREAIKHFNEPKDKQIVLLEPSSGDGSLALAMLEVLFENGYKKVKLLAFDIKSEFLFNLKNRVGELFPDVEVDARCEDFVDFAYNCSEPFVDIVISNPPYVRTQHLDKKYIDFANEKAGLNGRVDLYQIFLVLLSKVVKESGIISIVVSNKFLSNKTGKNLRTFLCENYRLIKIIDFGDSKMFDAAVLPVVLIMSPEYVLNGKEQSCDFISIYAKQDVASNEKINDIFTALDCLETLAVKDDHLFDVKYGSLQITDSSWSNISSDNNSFLETVSKHTFCYLQDLGKIRVGVKTTADKVFISKKWDELGAEKPELLRKLITHRIADNYISSKEDSFEILYPYINVDGEKRLVSLDDYPKAKKYLLSHYETLAGRSYLAEAHREWYEIWVPHSPAQWDKPKIVFRDICEHPTFWFDNSGAVVNGDCYWIDFFPETTLDSIYLALAISNSTFIEHYYDLQFHNQLYAGRRRFMSQYVSLFPILNPQEEVSKKIIALTKRIISSKKVTDSLVKEINDLVLEGFGVKN